MASSISEQLLLLVVALAAGMTLGLCLDVLWFLCCGLHLPFRWLWDTLFLLLAALLLFALLQYAGGSIRPDLLLLALGGVLLHETLAGSHIRKVLEYFAGILRLPLKYLKNLLIIVIIFMKKVLANAKNWFMIGETSSCLLAKLHGCREKEHVLADDKVSTSAADPDTGCVRISYVTECGCISGGGPDSVGKSAGGGPMPEGGERFSSAFYRRNRRRGKMGASGPTAVGTGCSRGNSDI